jgi:hypothetical protein
VILTDEKGNESILELEWCPEENDGTINPLDFDDTFPTMRFNFDGKMFVSESMAAC